MASAIFAKGKATISINPQETEARLIFTPDSDSEGWDVAAVNKLALGHQLGAYPDPKTLEAFLAKAGKAKDGLPLEMVFARGIEAEEPTDEVISWEALPVPNELAAFKDDALSHAEGPSIYKVKVERIKHETKIKKTGALPFMAGKEEIAVSWEKKETREKADVNTEVLDVKYAKKGEKLGRAASSTPGKPGKSVFGRPVPPGISANSSFLLGKGITRHHNELVADFSGFVRIGGNWADMVPMSKHSYQVKTGFDGITLFFHFEPGDTRFAVPSGDEILTIAAANGATEENLVSAEELNEAIAESVKTGEPIEAYALHRTQEAEARVEINQDKTRAALFLRKGVAGARPLEMSAINQALKESGISGFDVNELRTVIQSFMEGKELELRNYALLEGIPSTRGRDRELQLYATPLPDDEKAQIAARLKTWYSRNVSSDKGFDPEKEMSLAFVKKSAVIAMVTEGSEGEAGKDIFGNIIPGLPGNDPDIKLYKGLLLHGSVITAARDGLLLFDTTEKSFRGEVIEYQDARISVNISEGDMEAKGNLFREEGAGIPLNVENIQKVLKVLGIKRGIDWEGIKKACAQVRSAGSVSGCVLARGIAPIAKGGSEIKWHVPLDLPELLQAEASAEDELPDVIMTETDDSAGSTIQIKAGVPILDMSEVFPEGRPGYNVKGVEIPIDKGSPMKIEHDASVLEAPVEKGIRLIAGRSGELSFDGKMLKISSVKTIRSDAEGNIKFSGEIQISGNVLPGSVVVGGSHVIVSGLAEEALISAGGKAVVSKGFKGGGRGILRARAGIAAAFVERASVMAFGDIQLNKGSIMSSIKTNGKLLIAGENGKLSGGVCQARFGIDSTHIGSEKGVRTEISFGQDYFLKEQLDSCEEQITKIKDHLSKTEEKINEAQNNKQSIPEDVRREKVRLVKLMEQINLKVFTLREKFEEHFDTEIRIKGSVFPGVVIESHNRYYEVKQKRNRVVFYFDRESGRIKEKPLDLV